MHKYFCVPTYVPGDVTEFCQAIADTTRFSKRPIISHLAFIEGNPSVPNETTLQIPVSSYTLNDAIMQKRIHRYLENNNLPVSIYDNSIKTVAVRPLEARPGIHSYVSFRLDKQLKPRVTVYLALESHLFYYYSNPI